jgi:hypothetical protein
MSKSRIVRTRITRARRKTFHREMSRCVRIPIVHINRYGLSADKARYGAIRRTSLISVKPTRLANCSTYAHAYVIPVIGHRKLQDIDTATVNALYRHLLTAGRTRRDTNSVQAVEPGQLLRPPHRSRRTRTECRRHSHRRRNAIRRYRAGRLPKDTTAGLSPRAVASIHVMLRRALHDIVTSRYIQTNPAANARAPRSEKV